MPAYPSRNRGRLKTFQTASCRFSAAPQPPRFRKQAMPASFKTPHPANSKSWDQPLPNEAFIAVRRVRLNIHYSGGTVCALSACQRKSSRKHQVRPRQNPAQPPFQKRHSRTDGDGLKPSIDKPPPGNARSKQADGGSANHARIPSRPTDRAPFPKTRTACVACATPKRQRPSESAASAQPKPAIRFQTASALIQAPIALQCAPDCPKPPFSDGFSL